MVLDEIVSLDTADELATVELLIAVLLVEELFFEKLELLELVELDESLPPQPTICIDRKSVPVIKITLRISISPKILHQDGSGLIQNILYRLVLKPQC